MTASREGSAGGDTGLLVQELVYAGLEALRAVIPLDLCAYLHASGEGGPQLFLATPDLSTIEPAKAFDLFSSLRDAATSGGEESEARLAGYHVILVPTEGSRSRGLHVAGRADAPLTPAEHDTVARLARAMGVVAHALESSAPVATSAVTPLRVAVEMAGDRARAEVSVPFGPEIRAGSAEAASPMRAVANAVLDAIDGSLKLVETTEGDVASERAVLVLVADPAGTLSLGAALIDEHADSLRAAASATLEAALRLSV